MTRHNRFVARGASRSGSPRQAASRGRLAVRTAGVDDVRAVRPPAAHANDQVLAVSLGRRRPDDVGRSGELPVRTRRPRSARVDLQLAEARRVLQPHPRLPRAHRRQRDPPRRQRTNGCGRPDRPVPPAGHPARRRRHHLGLAAVAVRSGQPDPRGDRPRRHHPRLARRLRLGAARRRHDRRLGAVGVLHGAVADRHEQDRPVAVRGRQDRRCGMVRRAPGRHTAGPPLRDRRLPHRHGDRRPRRVRHRLRLDRRWTGQRNRGPRHPDLHPRLPRATGRPGVGARRHGHAPRARRHRPDPTPHPASDPRERIPRRDLRRPGLPAGDDAVHRPAVHQHRHHRAASVGIAAAAAWSGRPTRSGATSSKRSTSPT